MKPLYYLSHVLGDESTRSRFGLPTDASAFDELSCSPAGAASSSSCSANLLPRRPLALAGVLAEAALVYGVYW